MKLSGFLFFLGLTVMNIFAQSSAAISIPLLIKDPLTINQSHRFIYVGVDKSATDTLDEALGEAELPPPPPPGAWDVRLFFPDGLISSYTDYRQANFPFSGTITYDLQVTFEGEEMRIVWDSLPENITGVIMDKVSEGAILSEEMSGRDSLINNNKSLDRFLIKLTYNEVTSVDKLSGIPPENFILFQNYPNPFNPATNIKFQIPENSVVNISIYNVLGELVQQILNDDLSAGTYNIQWDASNLNSGVYFYEIRTPGFVSVKKMLLVK